MLAFVFGFSTMRVLNQIEDSHMATVKLHLITAIEFIGSGTNSFFREKAIRVSDWSSDGNIRETADRISRGKADLKESLGDYILTKKIPLDPYVLAAEVVDEQGKILASTITQEDNESDHLNSFDKETVFKLKFGENAFSMPILEGHHGVAQQLMAHFVSPLFSLADSSKRIGFLVIHVRLDSFFDNIRGENIKTTFGNPKLYLFDHTGKIYLPKEDSSLAKNEIDSILKECAADQKNENGIIKETTLPNGKKTIGALVCTTHGWWISYLAVDQAKIMSQIMQGRDEVALTLGLFLLLTMFIYAFIEFNTSKKIKVIVQVLRDVAGGNLKSRVTVRSSFFSEIIQSINATIDALEKTLSEEHELEKQVASLGRVKNEFISIAAHQIRTPLTSIMFSSDELDKNSKSLPENERGLIQMIKTSVGKLNDFINFLLAATRHENGATRFNLTSFALNELTEELMETLDADILKKELGVTVKLTPDPLPNIYTDREAVKQVIQNLLTNAIRYSKRAGKILIDIKLKDKQIEFAVQDNGIGIPASVKDQIFIKFFRAENAKEQSRDGIGLGLSFSKSLAESWGGKIWFESKEGNGSTFYVTIPVVGTPEAKNSIIG